MEDGTVDKLIGMVNRDHNRVIDEMGEGGYVNTGLLSAYMVMMFKMFFAFVEKGQGLDAARESFKVAVDKILDTMIDGCYDKEKDSVKF